MIAHIFLNPVLAKHAFGRRTVPDNCTKRYSTMEIVCNNRVIEKYIVQNDDVQGLEFSNVYFDEYSVFDQTFINRVHLRLRII